MVIKMLLRKHTQKLSLFYILILFFWGIISASSFTVEMSDIIRATEECYTTHSSAAIMPLNRTFPTQKYLSARNFNAQETVSVPKGRHIRPLPRSVRNSIAALFYGCLLTGIYCSSERPKRQEIPSHRFCTIIITNYIHHQDGLKD